ncbi:MAG: DNA primase [Candidatus Peribacteraceae bacterium]|nr:DNA primase [Candidatus Peribacteraceae bacterium]
MDPVEEIKSRLPIEELVGQYRQLTKKGRNFVCLCPFHNDTHPSMVVSPDKGIAFCFACNTGGDIFSFYQSIEGIDFRQAIKDLAERTGVELPQALPVAKESKDEKERLRSCLEEALTFFRGQLTKSEKAKAYLHDRKIPAEQIEQFAIGYAPDSFSITYEHLLKAGFSKSEIIKAGLGVQKDLKEGKIYDRFRNRLIFPIHDVRGQLVGFGGRTLGEDDAKYINSSEGPLYNKSEILYGMHHAKEALREKKTVIMVEGYFDVLACHRVGISNVVAVSGTALTEKHVRIIKRSCETVTLCLDQDQAGRDAAERAFYLCSAAGLLVQSVRIPQKDPDEAANAAPELLQQLLMDGGVPYIVHVTAELREKGISSVAERRDALRRLLPLINAVPSAVEQEGYIADAALLLGTTETALREDLHSAESQAAVPPQGESGTVPERQQGEKTKTFSCVEVALGLFLLYPQNRFLLDQIIEPVDGFAAALYAALREIPVDQKDVTVDALSLSDTDRERAAILLLYCEQHEFGRWSEAMAIREMKRNAAHANQQLLRQKQREITQKLLQARLEGKRAEEESLSNQYYQLLKLAKISIEGIR